MADVAEAPAQVGGWLGKKTGPFPRWVWIAGGVGAAAGVYFFLLKPSSSTADTVSQLAGTPLTGGSGGSSGGTTTTTTDTTTDAVVSNSDWLASTVDQVSKALGLPTSQVRTYLVEYLNGRAPYGNNSALSAFNQSIQSALQLGGKPPNGVQVGDINTNPYSDIGSYLGSLLSWIPASTSGSARQEIVDLYNGRVTDISQEAQNAIDSATSIIGLGPRQLSYTVGQAAKDAAAAAQKAKDDAAAAAQKAQDDAAAAAKKAADDAAAAAAKAKADADAAAKVIADKAAADKAALDKSIADARAVVASATSGVAAQQATYDRALSDLKAIQAKQTPAGQALQAAQDNLKQLLSQESTLAQANPQQWAQAKAQLISNLATAQSQVDQLSAGVSKATSAYNEASDRLTQSTGLLNQAQAALKKLTG